MLHCSCQHCSDVAISARTDTSAVGQRDVRQQVGRVQTRIAGPTTFTPTPSHLQFLQTRRLITPILGGIGYNYAIVSTAGVVSVI